MIENGKITEVKQEGDKVTIITEGTETSKFENGEDTIKQKPMGWICPKCGASLSPYITNCPWCPATNILMQKVECD